MNNKDLAISNDDLADIFGGAGIFAPEKSVEEKPAQLKKSVSPPALSAFDKSPADRQPMRSKLLINKAEEAYKAQENADILSAKKSSTDESAPVGQEHSVDDLIKRAQELEKEMTMGKSPELRFADFIDEKTVAEIIHAFNDLKAVFSKELGAEIDPRSVDNMMLRTLEKTEVNFILLKNTSWDSEGQLKQDGSIDTERFVKNMSAYREQIQEIDKEVEESLKALMLMRLTAVKKGLDAVKYAEIKNGLARRAVVVEGGYKKAVSNFIKKNIMENSMRKADEEK